MDLSLVYVTVVGAGLGVIARFLLPRRHTYGFALLPAIGAGVSAAIWVGVQWFDLLLFPLDWVAALGGALVASVVAALLVSRARSASDARELHVLSGGKA
jgi:membrane associated rhomboid family serine protease